MARGYLPLLLLVSGIWGASYLFIKVGLEDMEPSVMMTIRLLLAGCVLFVGLSVRTGVRRTIGDVRGVGRHALVLGVVNGALGGIFIGLAGVAVLAGVDPHGGWWAVAGALAVVLSSLAYARSNLYTQDNLPTTAAPVIVCAVGLTGGLLMLPIAIAQAPADFPGLKALGAVLALSVLGTAIASIAHYTMLQRYGSARTSLVAYLIPVTALVYGAAILDEPLALGALLGLALILAGVALGSGLARLARRPASAPIAERGL